jgi:hypothetical protein
VKPDNLLRKCFSVKTESLQPTTAIVGSFKTSPQQAKENKWNDNVKKNCVESSHKPEMAFFMPSFRTCSNGRSGFSVKSGQDWKNRSSTFSPNPTTITDF